MHDPRVLLDPATDAVRRLARRGHSLDLTSLEKLLAGRNSAIQRGDDARAESKRVATAVKGADPDERAELVGRARDLKAVIAAAEQDSRALDAELTDLLLDIPNLPADEIPDGASEDDAEVVRVHGEPVQPEFGALDVNVNAALSYTGRMDPVTGSVDTGAIPCRVRLVAEAQ